MGMSLPCRGLLYAASGLALWAVGSGSAAEPAPPRPVTYAVQATADVQITLPLPARATSRVLYRTAGGAWEPAPAEVAGEELRVSLRAASLAHGQTLLALDVPAGIGLGDTLPPAIVACTVDGVDAAPGSALGLGGVETAPQTIVLRLRDERNALATDSLP